VKVRKEFALNSLVVMTSYRIGVAGLGFEPMEILDYLAYTFSLEASSDLLV